MRFGDIIIAVASLFLVTFLISYPLEIVLIQILGLSLAPTIGALVSVLLGGLIIGYVFSRKIGNNRKGGNRHDFNTVYCFNDFFNYT